MIEYLRLKIEHLRSAYGGSNLNCLLTKMMERRDYPKSIFFNSQFPDQAESPLCCERIVQVVRFTQKRGLYDDRI
jgi:hypothetical protein